MDISKIEYYFKNPKKVLIVLCTSKYIGKEIGDLTMEELTEELRESGFPLMHMQKSSEMAEKNAMEAMEIHFSLINLCLWMKGINECLKRHIDVSNQEAEDAVENLVLLGVIPADFSVAEPSDSSSTNPHA